ncbi:hypothetical protein JW905_09570 [bacterium]|nr:hypothetical protein [candidate division CSSED10-310 bacterium]
MKKWFPLDRILKTQPHLVTGQPPAAADTALPPIRTMCFDAIVVLLLVVIFTWPVLPLLGSAVPGWGDDAYMFLWDLWWFEKALSSDRNPYQCSLIHHPLGANLAFHTLSPANCLLAMPLVRLTGIKVAYGAVFLLSFWLSGLAAYLLVLATTGTGRPAALFAAMVFAFSPYRTAHGLGHLNLLSTQWLPLYCLFMLATFRQPRLKTTLAAAGMLILTAYSCLNYAVLLALWTMVPLSLQARTPRRAGRIAIHLMLCATVSAWTAAPLLEQAWREIDLHGAYLRAYPADSSRWSADLAGFLTPSILNPLCNPRPMASTGAEPDYPPNWTSCLTNGVRLGPLHYTPTGHPHEWTVYIGLIPLLLMLAGIGTSHRHRWVWVTTAAVFLFLSLGPRLWFMGRQFSLSLPYSLLRKLPIAGEVRMPGRFFSIALVAVSVLSAQGLNRLTRRLSRSRRLAVFITAGCLLMLEYLVVPYPHDNLPTPPYLAAISGTPGAVLDLPLGWRSGTRVDPYERTVYQYYQTIHGRPTIGGHVSRFPPTTWTYFQSIPILRYLSATAVGEANGEPPSLADLDRLGIGWICVHRFTRFHGVQMRVINDSIHTRLCTFFEDQDCYERVYQDRDVTVFRRLPHGTPESTAVSPDDPSSTVMFCDGWSRPYPGLRASTSLLSRICLPPATGLVVLRMSPFHWDGGIPDSVPIAMEIDGAPIGQTILRDLHQTITLVIPQGMDTQAQDGLSLTIRNLERRGGEIGDTGRRSNVQLTIRSWRDESGRHEGFPGYVCQALVDGALLPEEPVEGWLLLALANDGSIRGLLNAAPQSPAPELTDLFNSLPVGAVTLCAYSGSSGIRSRDMDPVLAGIGMDLRDLNEQWSHMTCIGVKGTASGTAASRTGRAGEVVVSLVQPVAARNRSTYFVEMLTTMPPP